MKKVISFLVILVVLCGVLAVPVSAAGSGSLRMGTAEGNPGDTVTLHVDLNSNPGLVTMTIRVSYDTSVLQLINVSNPGLLVGAQLNTSYGSPYTISWVDGATAANNTKTGTIAAFTFKILDNAKLGDSMVSLQFIDSYDVNYQENSFFAASGKVSVQCKHSYGAWSDAGNGQHSRICSSCSGKDTASHTWNGGTITKQATCKEAGIKLYACTTCIATKTESIAKTSDHKYSGWTKLNDTTHKHTCSVCSKEETANHRWNSGSVTKMPTCKEEGVTTYTCTQCNATKKEAIAKTGNHTYGAWFTENELVHNHICSVCSKKETANHSWNSGYVTKKPTCKEEGVKIFTCTVCNGSKTEPIEKLSIHTYSNTCDTHCNVCGAARIVTHTYKSTWSKDENSHWHECSVCKDKKDAAVHTPGAEATETDAQTCTACGYVIKAALGHTHRYETEWTTDENGHWHTCTGCEGRGDYAEHRFDNVCNPICTICEFAGKTEHRFGANWTADASGHWQECTGCGLKQEESGHIPGAEATAAAAQSCLICNYEIMPALGEPEATEVEQTENTAEEECVTEAEESENTAEEESVTEAEEPENTAEQEYVPAEETETPGLEHSKKWLLGIGLVAAIVVVAGCAVAVVRKKKK